MNITIKNNIMKQYKTWKKSSEIDGMSKSIEVKEAENGFVISIHKSGFDRKENSPESYVDEYKCWISTENPLADQEAIEDLDFDKEEIMEYFKKL